MRVLLASNGLTTLGGSETYLLTLGRHLQRFGHEVHLLEGPGGEGTLAVDAGLPVVRRASSLVERPDRAVVQDAIVSGEVAAAWPDVPQVLVGHSSLHDLQLTSALPSSVAVIVTLNERIARRAEALAGSRPVVRLRQPVDVGHFTPGPPPRPVPRRLLLFGNNKAAWRYDGLDEACRDRGIEVVRVGALADNRVSDPLLALRDADIVVGYGRCILEAMACGRTAFVFDRFGADGWVDADTYPALEATGFSGNADAEEPGFGAWDRMLTTYDHRTGAVGHDLALRHHDARSHAVEVIELLDGLGPIKRADPDLSFTLARVWREQWRWEGQALGWAEEADRLRAELYATEARVEALEPQLEQALAVAALNNELASSTEAALADVLASRSYRLAHQLSRRPRWLRRRPDEPS